MIVCAAPDCERSHYSKGLCAMHYSRMWRNGDFELRRNTRPNTPGRAQCSVDGCEMEVAARSVCRTHYASKYKDPERQREYQRRWNWRKFGMTEHDYERMLASQDGVCAICGRPPEDRRLAVDHCHDSGKVRGLLCSFCNTVLGLMDDDIERLEAAIKYIRERG